MNTAHLPMKPAVSGIPAIESRKNANAPPSSGARRPTPVHRCSDVASPDGSRTIDTTANAPSIANP